MLKYVWIPFFSVVILAGCKKKSKKPEKKFISALSLIQEQVAHVDTSLYPIMRIEYIDSVKRDTVFIPREQFAAAAKDFLDIPDLADKRVAPRFKEETLYDATINRVVITYTPEDPAAEEIQKQELLVTPGGSAVDKVNTIIISRSASNRDSSVQKNMLWQMDRYFQVTTIRQLPGKPETTTTIRVTWNEDKYQ